MDKDLQSKIDALSASINEDVARAESISKQTDLAGDSLVWLSDVSLDVSDTDKKLTKLKRLQAHLEYKKRGTKAPLSPDDIAAAQSVHIRDLYPSDQVFSSGGNRYRMLCPFHTETNASCTLYDPPKGYYCFGCTKGGDSIDFVMSVKDLSFVDAVKYLLSV